MIDTFRTLCFAIGALFFAVALIQAIRRRSD